MICCPGGIYTRPITRVPPALRGEHVRRVACAIGPADSIYRAGKADWRITGLTEAPSDHVQGIATGFLDTSTLLRYTIGLAATEVDGTDPGHEQQAQAQSDHKLDKRQATLHRH